MGLTHKQSFNKMHGFKKDEPHSKAEIARLTKIPIKTINEVYKRGIGAYKTNPSSVRPQVKSPEQWAMARVYAYAHKREAGLKLTHDTDLP